MPEEIKKEVLVIDTKDNRYQIRFKNKIELEKYLKDNKVDEKICERLMSIYESNTQSEGEIKKKILEETSVGKELIELWENSDLSHLSLTSVGIVIGASYFEQTIGEKININYWIN